MAFPAHRWTAATGRLAHGGDGKWNSVGEDEKNSFHSSRVSNASTYSILFSFV